MTSMGALMADPKGSGEQVEQQLSRRFWRTLALSSLAGAVVGVAMVLGTGNNIGGEMPAAWAIGAALVYALGILAASWYFYRFIDEVELRDNLIASTVSVYFYAIAYPVWYLLWKGGLTVEPIHEAIFMATIFVMAVAYLWKKFRP